MAKRLSFSVRSYDADGDMTDSGIFIHIDNAVILRFEDHKELQQFFTDGMNMLSEISDTLN